MEDKERIQKMMKSISDGFENLSENCQKEVADKLKALSRYVNKKSITQSRKTFFNIEEPNQAEPEIIENAENARIVFGNYFTLKPKEKILILGQSKLQKTKASIIMSNLGIASKNRELILEYLDSKKIGRSITHVFKSPHKYAGIIRGPIAHSVSGKSGTQSLFDTDITIIDNDNSSFITETSLIVSLMKLATILKKSIETPE